MLPDISQLRVLVAVMDERNVTRAAERLHLSQPAASIALKRLREAFGDPLFVPARRGVIPTPRAIQLAHRASAILSDLEDMTVAGAFDPATAEQTVFMGANDFGLLGVVAPLLERLRRVAPGIGLHIVRLDANLDRQFDRQEIDMALTIMTEPNKKAYVQPIFRESFACAVGRTHPLAREELTLESFCAHDHVRVSWADRTVIDPVDSVLSDLGRRRRFAATLPSYFSLPRLLENTDLIAVAPSRIIAHFPDDLVALPLPISVPGIALNLVWDDRTHASACHTWLREQILGHPDPGETSAALPA